MKKILCLFLCVCMLLALSSPALAADSEESFTAEAETLEIKSTEPVEEPVMPMMVERTGFDEGQYLGGYYDLHFYARADRVYGAMGYQYQKTLGIRLDVITGILEAGLYFEPYHKTTYSYNSRNHEHMWDSGTILALEASASYSINGGTVNSLGGRDLQF